MTQTAQPVTGLGTILSIGTQGGSPTYTAIGGSTELTPPKPKWGTEDVTTLNQTLPARNFIKSLLDEGEAEGSGFWESADAGQQELQTAFYASSNSANGAAFPFKLALPVNLAGGQTTTGDTITFSALVTDFAIGKAEPGKPVPYSFTLKINGSPAPTFTEGS